MIAKALVVSLFVFMLPLAEGCSLIKTLKKKGARQNTEQADSIKTKKKQVEPKKNEKQPAPQKKDPVDGQK